MSLRDWLEKEGLGDSEIQIWVARADDPPLHLPPGPWVVVSEEALSESQRQRWLGILDEESSLVAPWSAPLLRSVMRRKPLDSAALARLYSQGGRALADRILANFLELSPGLLARAEAEWQQGNHQQARAYLERLQELAGGVGDNLFQDLLEQVEPDWPRLRRELEDTLRILDNQRRQDRTV